MHDFLNLIRSRRSFLLTGHENPDGDCLGAQVALFHLLCALRKEVCIVNPDPIDRSHEFLTRHTPFGHARGGDPLPQVEVVVLLDCAQLSRVGPLGARLAATGATVAVVDHHVGSEHGDGAVSYVDSRAPATGAMVRRLFRALEVPLSPAAAEGVFLSLVADTGWFRYSNTDPEVLTMAAELVQAGVEPSELYDRLYRRMHRDSVGILAEALQRHRLQLGGRLAIAALDRGLMERAAHAGFDTDLVLDPLRSIDGVEVVALLKERRDGSVKLSLRARRDVDVQRVAVSFGGGGHKKAAGATVALSLAEAAVAVEDRVREALAAVAPQGRA